MTAGAGGADAGVAARVAGVVTAVARQALVDHGVGRIALLDDGSPEARLVATWLEAALPAGALRRVSEPPAGLEPLLRSADDAERPRAEAIRLAARLIDDALVANPANRTAILLSGDPPPDRLLPLGDLLASQVAQLAGGWSAPAEVRRMADGAGGIEVLDAALSALLDRRDPAALDTLPEEVRLEVRMALDRGRAARRNPWLVPKLGYRTLGVDLFQ